MLLCVFSLAVLFTSPPIFIMAFLLYCILYIVAEFALPLFLLGSFAFFYYHFWSCVVAYLEKWVALGDYSRLPRVVDANPTLAMLKPAPPPMSGVVVKTVTRCGEVLSVHVVHFDPSGGDDHRVTLVSGGEERVSRGVERISGGKERVSVADGDVCAAGVSAVSARGEASSVSRAGVSRLGGSRFDGSHAGGARFGGARFGGSRSGGSRSGGSRFGGSRFGGSRFGGSRFG
ncbi:hypothetical protein O0I10_012943, partial [Lichtheimia ornata]